MMHTWPAPYPESILPCRVTWLADAVVGETEIIRSPVHGLKIVGFSENPEKLGSPETQRRVVDQLDGSVEGRVRKLTGAKVWAMYRHPVSMGFTG
jgi:hypothetical protein